jgi:heavy-metal-associated domain-containing protein
MHIVTGMLIAGLLGKGKKASLLPMLRHGPVNTEHALPGRVRFSVPSLKDDDSKAEFLQEKLCTLDGVQSVNVAPVTGSVLIGYREGVVQPELLYAAVVRLMGLDKELEKTPRPKLVKELRSVLDSLNRVVYDRTGGILDFSSSLLIVLAAVGVKKMFAEGAKAMPAGFTLLWWGAHHLMSGGGAGEE